MMLYPIFQIVNVCDLKSDLNERHDAKDDVQSKNAFHVFAEGSSDDSEDHVEVHEDGGEHLIKRKLFKVYPHVWHPLPNNIWQNGIGHNKCYTIPSWMCNLVEITKNWNFELAFVLNGLYLY